MNSPVEENCNPDIVLYEVTVPAITADVPRVQILALTPDATGFKVRVTSSVVRSTVGNMRFRPLKGL